MEKEKQRKKKEREKKKGEKKENPGMYRPVSLASVPSKILEQILLETMLSHVENKEVICDIQYGFKKGKLCLSKLVGFYNGITVVVNEGKAIEAIAWVCAKHLMLCHTMPLSLKWRETDSMNKERLHSNNCNQWLNVLVETSDKGHSSRVNVDTITV